ncbi:hypothetical protein BESB_037160 [Besnoitia besnoiti]|uniref:Uncharacterized protein n=1 Tax=Besnoitia besnoiti TaxID=94643 RepID=A0A2A9MFI0_BESBE|nr:hypothetical protein BESB_037160 [Besnoitia besnoiti]PFH37258.1 hypothetical protein BESB_037160 [Besnoitia besnoiti]
MAAASCGSCAALVSPLSRSQRQLLLATSSGPSVRHFASRTSSPLTAAPLIAAPLTAAPLTAAPLTAAPLTAAPLTAAPLTAAPLTAAPLPRLAASHGAVRSSHARFAARHFSSTGSFSPSLFARLRAKLNEMHRFWLQKTLLEKARYYSVVANTAFIVFMSTRLLDLQKKTDSLWEEELSKKSGESEDWKCYHVHRLFHSQCRDLPSTFWSSGVRTPKGGPADACTPLARERSGNGDPKAQQGDAAAVDILCRKLELEIEKCRDSLVRYLPKETPAMQEITDITNLPPWIKDRPVYVHYFAHKKRANGDGEQGVAEPPPPACSSCQ